MSSNNSVIHVEPGETFNIEALKASLTTLSKNEKQLAVYWLLRDLMGDRPEKESSVSDPEGFLYMHFVPPGIREYLREKEHPELLEQRKKASLEPTIPLAQVREEIRKELGLTEEEFYADFPTQ